VQNSLSKLPPLRILDARLAICRLSPKDAIPAWAEHGAFVSITRTDRELAIVADAAAVPGGVPCQTGHRALGFDGKLDFALTGVLAGLCQVLADAEISVFAISTYDSDYVLVREPDLDPACSALRAAGYRLQATA